MNNFPIDAQRLMDQVTRIEDIDPVMATDETGQPTGEQVRNQDRIPKWKLVLSYKTFTRAGKARREFIEVAFHAPEAPQLIDGGSVVLENLNGLHWENTNNGRFASGVSLRADGVKILPPRAQKQPATPA